MSIPNRLAVAGEELVTHRFQSGSLGLAAPEDRPKGFWAALKRSLNPPVTPAVCIPPGARLMLQDISPEMQRSKGLRPCEEVTFTQITALDNNYRDAVRFCTGEEVRLQELRDGMRVRVLDLCGGENFVPSWDERLEFHPPLR
jgi:hypothetical protein